MNNPSVAIIIVNWNGTEDTIDCIESLRKIGYQNYKIFLIDNGSDDDSFSKFQSLYVGAKDIELTRLNQNFGFAGGNNIGVKDALAENFDYILLLNNDTTVEPDFLDELVKVAQSDGKIGIVGPKIYFHPNYDCHCEEISAGDRRGNLRNNKDCFAPLAMTEDSCPLRIWFGGGKFTWLGGGRHLQYEEIDRNPDEKKTKETEYMTGCALLIKSEVVQKIGLLEESFFMYYEDTDWSLRARKAGYKILYVSSAKIYHKVSRSASKLGNPIIHYYHIRNALLLSKRQAPKIILAGIYIWSGFHYLKQMIKLAILPSKKDISKMIMRGIEDFYKNKFGQHHEA